MAAPPPARLRGAVLAAAVAVRPAGEATSTGYATWVERFDTLLESLTPAQWRERALRDLTVQDLVAHLIATDELLVAQLGAGGTEVPEDPAELDGTLPRAPQRRFHRRAPGPAPWRTRAAWRAQTDRLLRDARSDTPGALDRPVRLADPRLPRQPLRTALVQRLFETCIHTDDLRRVLGAPPAPPDERHVALIVGFGVRPLPAAMRLAGADRPPHSARLVLVGPGGGDWTISPAVQDAPTRPPGRHYHDGRRRVLLPARQPARPGHGPAPGRGRPGRRRHPAARHDHARLRLSLRSQAQYPGHLPDRS